ncbi:MAG: hypothetical protein ACE5HY_03680 [Candidatus Hydrothermarchaeales archaeon]
MDNGIEMVVEGKEMYLDPKRVKGLSFISHAHSDHTPKSYKGEVISTKATRRLLRNFSEEGDGGYEFNDEIQLDDLKIKILESGHILGSSQIRIENSFTLTYTGDLDVNGGQTTGKAEIQKCDILIIESTFGSPYYRFPEKAEVLKQMRDWINDCFSRDITPIFVGYSLGKAQDLTKAFSKDFEVVVHEKIYDFNRKYEELGVDLGEYQCCSEFNGKGDYLIIVPPGAKDLKIDFLKEYSKALVSGWAVHGGAKYRYGADEAFAFSNHSDFESLVSYVERASPQVVYTVHGFAAEFSKELNAMGFYSQPLKKVDNGLQKSLNDFL